MKRIFEHSSLIWNNTPHNKFDSSYIMYRVESGDRNKIRGINNKNTSVSKQNLLSRLEVVVCKAKVSIKSWQNLKLDSIMVMYG